MRPRKRSGRPKKLSKKDERRLLRESKSDHRQPLAEITANVVPHASIRTVKRRLKEHNIRKWLAAERPLLDEKLSLLRLEWALRYKDWTEEDWKKVI